MKKILFLTTINMALNPRILKEIRLALPTYDVTFLGFRMGNWSDTLEQQILDDVSSVNAIYLSASRKPFIPWFFSSVIKKISEILWKMWRNNLYLTAMASNKRTWLMVKKLKALGFPKFDLVIGHTLGAFYPAYLAGGESKTRYAFDIEDYHPGERIEHDAADEKVRREVLMQKLLPYATYISYPAPLIGKETLKLLGGQQIDNILVQNSFEQREFIKPVAQTNRLAKFVWFSQNINGGRGLELIIPTLALFQDRVSLTLIGNLDEKFGQQWLFPNSHFIKVKRPLPQRVLHEELSNYDVGLAVELSRADFNKNLCLSNKLIAFFQAGLFILATDTAAQKDFIREYLVSAYVCNQNEESIYSGIQYVVENLAEIRARAEDRFIRAAKLSWENESAKLTKKWESVLSGSFRD